MATTQRISGNGTPSDAVTRDELINLLNEDLAREYQAVIAYTAYSQSIKGAQFMTIANELKAHASEELEHALTIARLVDYLGGTPTVQPQSVAMHDAAEDMLRQDLEYENETVRNYRERVRQAEALGEYAIAEQIRRILVQEQDHQIELADALGQEVTDVTAASQRA